MCALCVCRQSPFMTQSNVRPGIWALTSLSARRMCWTRDRGNVHHQSGLLLLPSDCTHSLKIVHTHTLTEIFTHRQTLLYLYIPISLSVSYTFSYILRVEAVCPRVAELNPYVHVDLSSSALDDDTDLSFLSKYQVRYCFSQSGLWPTLNELFLVTQ